MRLRYAYFVRCEEVIHDAAGNVTELRCTYDPLSRGGNSPDGRKVKSTIHWVSAQHAVTAEVRLFDRLVRTIDPNDVAEGGSWKDNLNPDSLQVVTAYLEPELGKAQLGDKYQFERLGYFALDPDTTADKLVFNRTATLKDTWAAQKE